MHGEQLDENQGNHVDNYELFLAALKNRLASKEHTQAEIADSAGITANYMSLLVRGKRRASDDVREAIANVLGVSLRELINEGYLITYGKPIDSPTPQKAPASPQIPGVDAGYINPSDFLQESVTFVNQYQKADQRLHYWRTMFDALPVAAMIIKDGLLCYQNVKGRSLGNLLGEPICAACVGEGCCGQCRQEAIERGKCDDCPCPIAIAMRTGQPAVGNITFDGVLYTVNVSPISLQGHEYYLVVATGAR